MIPGKGENRGLKDGIASREGKKRSHENEDEDEMARMTIRQEKQ